VHVTLDDQGTGNALDAVDLSDVLGAAAHGVLTRAQAIVPVRTGRLRRSIRITDNSRGRRIIEATAPYAPYVAYGGPNNPHPVPFLDLAARPGRVAADVEHEVASELREAGL
jgi:hypothetical protein